MALDKNKLQAFKGFETFWTDLRMRARMSLYVFSLVAGLQAILNVVHFVRKEEKIFDMLFMSKLKYRQHHKQ